MDCNAYKEKPKEFIKKIEDDLYGGDHDIVVSALKTLKDCGGIIFGVNTFSSKYRRFLKKHIDTINHHWERHKMEGVISFSEYQSEETRVLEQVEAILKNLKDTFPPGGGILPPGEDLPPINKNRVDESEIRLEGDGKIHIGDYTVIIIGSLEDTSNADEKIKNIKEKYPHISLTKDAEVKIENYIEDIKKKIIKDEDLWEVAKSGNSKNSFKEYLKTSELSDNYKSFKDEASREYDNLWWEELKGKNDLQKLREYYFYYPSFLTIEPQHKRGVASSIDNLLWLDFQNAKTDDEKKLAIDVFLNEQSNPEPDSKHLEEIQRWGRFYKILESDKNKAARKSDLDMLVSEITSVELKERIKNELTDLRRERLKGRMKVYKWKKILTNFAVGISIFTCLSVVLQYTFKLWVSGLFDPRRVDLLVNFIMLTLLMLIIWNAKRQGDTVKQNRHRNK